MSDSRVYFIFYSDVDGQLRLRGGKVDTFEPTPHGAYAVITARAQTRSFDRLTKFLSDFRLEDLNVRVMVFTPDSHFERIQEIVNQVYSGNSPKFVEWTGSDWDPHSIFDSFFTQPDIAAGTNFTVHYLKGTTMYEFILEHVWPNVNRKRMLVYCALDPKNKNNRKPAEWATFSLGVSDIYMKHELAELCDKQTGKCLLEKDGRNPTTAMNPDAPSATEKIIREKLGVSLSELADELNQIHTVPGKCSELFIDPMKTLFHDLVVGGLKVRQPEGYLPDRMDVIDFIVEAPTGDWYFACVASNRPADEGILGRSFMVEALSHSPEKKSVRVVIAPSFPRNETILAADPATQITLIDPVGFYSLRHLIGGRQLNPNEANRVFLAFSQLGLLHSELAAENLFP